MMMMTGMVMVGVVVMVMKNVPEIKFPLSDGCSLPRRDEREHARQRRAVRGASRGHYPAIFQKS